MFLSRSLRFAAVLLVSLMFSGPLSALSTDPQGDIDSFVRMLREDKRVDMLGYLVFLRTPTSRETEDRVFGLAGKVVLGNAEGYMTHVNFTRLERIRKAGFPISIIDKKRLNDRKEFWYLTLVNSPEKERVLREKFEPLWKHGHTIVIRIRPEDEAHLADNQIMYSRVEETLLPLCKPAKAPVKIKVEVNPDVQKLLELITAEEMTSIVQSLENCVSRHVRYPGNASGTRWLAEEFAKLPGLEVATPTFTYSTGPLSNVVAIKKGVQEPNTVFVVCGHIDSTVGWSGGANAPGADDNGTGAAGVLQIARALRDVQLPYTVVFAGMNAEEVGLIGSKALAKKMAAEQGQTIQAVFNMDMIADRDDNEVAVIGNTRSNWLIDVFKDAALAYTGLKSKTLYDSDIWQSDHSSYWNIGVSAILTIEGYPEMSAYYHKPTDLVINLVPAFMERIARSNLAALLTLNPPMKKQD